MKKPIFGAHAAVALLVGTLLAVPAPAQAAYYNCEVTTAADVVADDGETSLRECLEEQVLVSGDTLSVSFAEEYEILLDRPIAAGSPGGVQFAITGPASIGPSQSFSTNEFSYLLNFVTSGDSLHIGNLNFLAHDHGHLRVLSWEFSAEDCTFTDSGNSAIYSTGGDTRILDSTFEGNSGEIGAAVYSSGDLFVFRSSFVGGYSLDGAALFGDQNVFVRDSHFQGNEALGSGGAIYALYDTTVIRSSFVGNEAGNGGAIYGAADDDGDETYIFFSTFYDNYANNGDGGAVYQYDEDVFVFNSTFVDNESDTAESDDLYIDGEDAIVFGSIFVSEWEDYAPFSFAEDAYDLGANFFTGSDPFSDYFYGDTTAPSEFDVARSDFELGELQLLDSGTYGFIPGSGSVAGSISTLADFELAYGWAVDDEGLPEEVWDDMLYIWELVDQRQAVLTELFSSGSVDSDTEIQPVPYFGPVVTNDPQSAGSGSTVTYLGSDLDTVLSATIGGKSATVISKSDATLTLRVPTGLEQGMHDVILQYSTTEHLTLQNGFILQDAMKVWTKLQSDNTVKMYAKNIIGEGKIQFFHNGEEIAWIRATDSLNPKLSFANGSHYLVRTRELVAGKNAFEIHLDGTRIWRAAYAG